MYKLLALVFAAAFFASSSFAAPRAQSAEECGIAADMALVAQSLAREEIQPAKARAIMGRIYDVAESERGRALMKDILDAAYTRSAASGRSADGRGAQKFAEELFSACMKSGGNMDTVLGQRS
jgi:lipopolysaccharide export LptBFGC system permease protein LptF